MTNRIHIDAPAGVIDLEGEKEFVEGLLAKLFPLIEEAGFGSRPRVNGATAAAEPEPDSDETLSAEKGTVKGKKRRVGPTPKGQSCAARILALRQEGFFKQHRSTPDIVEGLKSKGWTHAGNQVAAALSQMFKTGQIQRTKEGKGAWKHYWDRE